MHGGVVDVGDALTFAPAAGAVWYTTDGSDPRLTGGTVNVASAVQFNGTPLGLSESTRLKARVLTGGGEWSAVSEGEFFVTELAGVGSLAVTEVNYHPPAPTAGESAAGQFVAEDFEFIELANISGEAIDVGSVAIVDGVQFLFPDDSGAILLPGERVVVVANQAAFDARYGAGVRVAGEFAEGNLRNGGERVAIEDRFGNLIQSFDYSDGGDWPGRADGSGSTLEVIDPAGDANDPANWRASALYLGTPGAAGPAPFTDIVINELLTHTDPPLLDAIELYNASGADVDIGGWYLSDSSGNLRKFRIPPGTRIEAGEFVLFDENDFNPSGGADPENNPLDFALNSAEGDDVWLMAADAAGKLTRFADHAEFGAAAGGVSFGRVVDSTGRAAWIAQTILTLDGPNGPPRTGPVVIDEIHYHPAAGGGEFVELRNISPAAVRLYDPAHPENTWRLEGAGFDFPPGIVLFPGENVLLVPVEPNLFRAAHGVPAAVRIFGPFAGSLDNGGEWLRLQRPDAPQPALPGQQPLVPRIDVDAVRYRDRDGWPTAADGGGATLQRLAADQYGNDPANWAASFAGGTPGIEPPRVAEVLLSGSGWSAALVDELRSRGLGDGGYSIPAGGGQLATIPWTGVDTLRVRFTADVNLSPGDLAITGVNVADYAIAALDYSSAGGELVATWTLAAPLRADRVQLSLAGVSDLAGRPLDGNWTDGGGSFPSGNGVLESSDPFTFSINILPGDADGDGGVSRRDVIALLPHLGTAAGSPAFNPRLDTNADGQINLADLRATLARLPGTLPSITPLPVNATAPATPASRRGLERIAVDAALARLPSTLPATPLPATSPPTIAPTPASRRGLGRIAVDAALCDLDELLPIRRQPITASRR